MEKIKFLTIKNQFYSVNLYQNKIKIWSTIINEFKAGCGVQPCQAMRPKGGFCYQKHGLLHDNVEITLGKIKKPASYNSWFIK